ncbi:unnamed protein product [Allacma fusca]|uniref:Uncharacterized protein n=1 Tax=Allacma fusca TaxID=39272 RepID=A0A8J2L0K5_9HEXA|nr:unnamed protein product [Allacma fusca]
MNGVLGRDESVARSVKRNVKMLYVKMCAGWSGYKFIGGETYSRFEITVIFAIVAVFTDLSVRGPSFCFGNIYEDRRGSI